LPLIGLIIQALTENLGANPVETIIRDTGQWSLRFLLLTLMVTPFRLISGWHDLNKRFKLRRLFGLYAFFYASLHFASYFLWEQDLAINKTVADLLTRPAMTIGFLAFLLMIPLAITSHSILIKRLGKVRWKRLHQLTYPIAIGSVLHFWWVVKADVREPAIYAIILAALLLLRYPPLLNRFTKKEMTSMKE
jgi:sulfoxide reductase heme-binding subunit YedZ